MCFVCLSRRSESTGQLVISCYEVGSAEVTSTKKPGTKRSWSTREEGVLIGALKGLVAQGWKSDNGFKGGYLNLLENAMKNAFPQTDLRGKPHIESKLVGWKRTYAQLSDILNRSGVGFNVHGDNKIDCEDELWDEICKPSSAIRNWRNKSWDYLEDWRICFGKDRATGEGAADVPDLVNLLDEQSEWELPHKGGTGSPDIKVEDVSKPHIGGGSESVAHSTADTGRPSNKGKKRPFDSSISNLVDLVANIAKNNESKLEHIQNTFPSQPKPLNLRGHMWALIRTCPGLSMKQKFVLGEWLLQNQSFLELFLELSEEERPEYCQRILEMDG